jgi:serine/threonine protein kinase
MLAEGPVAFPPPQIKPSVLRKIQVLISPQEVKDSSALESSAGNVYELGRCLKEAIYGQVCYAVRLNRLQEGVYERDFPLQQFAIKVYSKQRLRAYHGKTQENPVKELSAMQFIGEHEHIMSQEECCQDKDHVYSIMQFCDGRNIYFSFNVL